MAENSSGPFTLQHVKANPASYIGPGLVSTFLQAVLTGVLYGQSVKFWSTSHGEKPIVKYLVAFVSLVALYQTAAAFWDTWQAHVTFYGDWVNVVNFSWPIRTQNVITMVMSCPVQMFLIWRCYVLSNRRLLTLLPLGILLLGNVVVSAVTTAMVFDFDFIAPLRGPVAPLPSSVGISVEINYTLSMVFSAVMDVTLTTLLLIFLFRSRSSVATQQFRRVLYSLIAITWESALPPCVCAITTMAVFICWAEHNYWNLVPQSILGKLYVISLLFTLNSRADLRAQVSANQIELPQLYWTSLPQVTGEAREGLEDQIEETHPPVSPVSQTQEGDEKDWYGDQPRRRCACPCCPSQSSSPV
ncbi:hypothetical protein OE88DRAFT_1661703 [Heliocybe sulcata]|uniref:DUF6534 domain-containing protein n=1 Tax=Heliocybe sulcata TaxID=5364 RepID=A0A5C3MZ32_9AGAM|nr:hypothetical protein OE88DRAFT_1661703 [Heliocybe sulcata]